MTLRYSENPVDDLCELEVLTAVSLLKGQFQEANSMSDEDAQNIWDHYQKYLHGEASTQESIEQFIERVTEQFRIQQPSKTKTLVERKELTLQNFQETMLYFWNEEIIEPTKKVAR